MVLLEVIVGMMFTYLLLSLLGTTINELISSWRGWRGFYLEEGLKRLLKFDEDESVFKKFTDNEFYKQLMQHKTPLRVSRAPEYLSSSNFVSILMNTLKKGKDAVAKVDDVIEGLPEGNKLREVLEQFREEAPGEVDKYKERLEAWFDDVMSHTSGWYKRHLQFVTMFVGLSIAMVLNADSFNIYAHLTNNATARASLANMADSYMAANKVVPMPAAPSDSMTLEEIKVELQKFTDSEEFSKMSNILGLGWERSDLFVGFDDWLVRVLGWFITALAISLGATFWFNALKKIISIRSSENSQNPTQVVINTGKEGQG